MQSTVQVQVQVQGRSSIAYGVGNTGILCSVNNMEACSGCNAGHYLDSSLCRANVCSCSDGVGATGTSCPTNGDELCTSCNTDFVLENGACAAANILAGNPHSGNNCEYYGLDLDQRGPFYRGNGQNLAVSYDNAEQAWRLQAGGSGGHQWLVWFFTFANRQFRATFQAKFLSTRTDEGRDGLDVYNQFHDQWLKDAGQMVGVYVSADVVVTLPNAGGPIAFIFDGDF